MMGKNLLPPGFRFHPTDVELVKFYLKRKVLGKKIPFKAIAEVDIYRYAPWDLPDMSCLKTRDLKWFFYCPIEKKYGKGSRMNRATVHGYWKTTGKDRTIKDNDNVVVGMIKTLVFHRGKAPSGERTNWVMHEYRLTDTGLDTYVICVLFEKEGLGPRNGAQYGAPFKEEDWSDDEDVTLSLSGIPILAVGASSSCAGPSVVDSVPRVQVPLVVDSVPQVPVPSAVDSAPQVSVVGLVAAAPQIPVPSVVDSAPQVSVVGRVAAAPQIPVVADARAVLAPQLAPFPPVQESNDPILSMLDIFTEDDDAFITYCRGQVPGISVSEAPKVSNNSVLEAPKVSEDEDILFMLESFKEDNYLNNMLYPFD